MVSNENMNASPKNVKAPCKIKTFIINFLIEKIIYTVLKKTKILVFIGIICTDYNRYKQWI
jgi:hypothetical protein